MAPQGGAGRWLREVTLASLTEKKADGRRRSLLRKRRRAEQGRPAKPAVAVNK